MAGMAAGQASDIESNDTENATVDVTVDSTIAVDIQPANLDYTSASVGDRSESSDRGFGSIEIENTGSEYIDRIWVNASAPQSDPFGTGNANSYDAGNFLEVRPTSDLPETNGVNLDDYHFVNRKEFMYQSDSGSVPSFIQVPSGWNEYAVTPLRRGNETIYAAIDTDSSFNCDGSSTAPIRVGNVSSTDSRLGSVDFTDDANSDSEAFGWREYQLGTTTTSQGTGYGQTEVGLNWTYTGNDDLNYDLLTSCSDPNPNSVRTRYNVNAEGIDNLDSDGDETNYLLDAVGTQGDMLPPGSLVTLNTAINVPEGVAQGSVDPGTFRVLITADETVTTDP